MIVSGSYDEAVFLWDVRTARLMRSLPAHSDPVSGTDFVRDGTLIASCSSDGLIRIWDTITGQCLKTLVHEDNAAVTSVKFSPNGKMVLAATLDSSIRLWDYVNGRCLKTYQGHRNQKYSINATFGTYGVLSDPRVGARRQEDAHSDDHDRKWAFVICGSEDGTVVLWDVSSKEVLQTFQGHDGVVLGVDVGLEDQTIATCGLDGTVKIWKRQPLPETPTNGHDDAPIANGDHELGTDEKMKDADT
jgi:COMPASS component SWD3